jgi:mono/diheme cytochrome c family protein
VGPVLRALVLAGQMPAGEAEIVDHTKPIPTAPMPGPTTGYGKYIVTTGGCIGCHGKSLSGGPVPGGDPSWPPAANITPTGLKAYDEAAFFKALRDGVRPSGTAINPAMPYRLTKEMTDDEIRAVWAYLKTVPAKEFKQN